MFGEDSGKAEVLKEAKKLNPYEIVMLVNKYNGLSRVTDEMLEEANRQEAKAKEFFAKNEDSAGCMAMIVAMEIRKWYDKLINC